MTQDEIIKMAKQVGFPIQHIEWQKATKEFAALVAAKVTEETNAKANASWTLMCKKMVAFEREACAKVCEDGLNIATCFNALDDMEMWGEKFAKAIRARTGGQTTMIEVLKQALEALERIEHPDQSDVIDVLRQAIKELESQEPVGKLQEPTVERAWFTIDELNAWADKKLSENPHWVMPKDEPERNEPPPQRTEQLKACVYCGQLVIRENT